MNFLDYYLKTTEDALLQYRFNQCPTELYEPINYILSHGGKRLRPVMVLMGNQIFDGNIQQAIKPALAVEFFHNFTLIHDDIMDEAPLRRGKSTIHQLYGINVGILSGDALLIKAYQFFEDLEPAVFKKCIKIFSETGAILCEGQQMDVNFESLPIVTYEQYIEMITAKTGVLSAASLQIGATIAGASESDARFLYEFGKHIGIAFQIMDDYLDVFGDVALFGKKHAGDIYENKKTILYLLALENASEQDREELQYWYSKKTDNVDKIHAVMKIFRNAKIEERVLRLIEENNHLAHQYLERVQVLDEKKNGLKQLADFLLKRNS